jgi:hypothetical protein
MRNVIERLFGVLKREFKMAREPNEYPIHIQCLIHLSLTLLHNFLRVWEPSRFSDELDPKHWRQPADMNSSNEDGADDAPQPSGARVSCHDALREKIATEMWMQYQQTLEHRRQDRHH